MSKMKKSDLRRIEHEIGRYVTKSTIVDIVCGIVEETYQGAHPDQEQLGMTFTVGQFREARPHGSVIVATDMAGISIGRMVRYIVLEAGYDLTDPGIASTFAKLIASTDFMQVEAGQEIAERLRREYGEQSGDERKTQEMEERINAFNTLAAIAFNPGAVN